MDEMKRKRLENAGFRFGDAYAFLDSTEEEIRKAESPSKGDACCLAKIPVKGMEGLFIPCGRKSRPGFLTCLQHKQGFELQEEANERTDN